MKIEFLKDGSDDCPLIRIFGNEPSSAARLAIAFRQLASGETKEIAIHEMPGFNSIGGCLLIAKIDHKNIGIQAIDDNAFECLLTPEGWERLAELVDPFTEKLEGVQYQWLDDTSEISLVISSSELGEW